MLAQAQQKKETIEQYYLILFHR
ncbi:hypothetical protein KL86PLE_41461 [uncultured Pleomorphomonas sp.]|uniref:Uncharacterized protein n=1 Tax=uncultured Pleomorphomonas sp. TaxID=442121 RepID=A0A212LJB4_9HYPH|nr:hypothetical protein KL86PLE_41461 [uncultured Pleomorphomonas sp.]